MAQSGPRYSFRDSASRMAHRLPSNGCIRSLCNCAWLVIGVTRELDLAVIKIEAHALPAVSIRSSLPSARQGEMVFAFGSPEGLRNTVTMGVLSAVARQPGS
jgi:hypothetical protein